MLPLESLHALAEVLHQVECQPGARPLAEWSAGHITADRARAKAICKALAAHGMQIRLVGGGVDLSDDVLAVSR
jgi:hypothetical protein